MDFGTRSEGCSNKYLKMEVALELEFGNRQRLKDFEVHDRLL